MYIGRIVAVGKNADGKAAALYRVSSRSFPNREAVINGSNIAVVPRHGHEADLHKHPYIAYNCARPAGRYMVVSNGSQTDPIAEKIGINVPVRDAITMGLLAMDYEKDQLDTPRIVGVISQDGEEAYLGIIRKDAVMVRRFTPENGELFYISTYEKNYTCPDFNDGNFNVQNALEAADYITGKGVFADFTNPVTAAAALASGNGFELAVTRVD